MAAAAGALLLAGCGAGSEEDQAVSACRSAVLTDLAPESYKFGAIDAEPLEDGWEVIGYMNAEIAYGPDLEAYRFYCIATPSEFGWDAVIVE